MSGVLFCWEFAFRHLICGFYLLFLSQSGCPPRFKNFPQTRQCKTPFPGWISVLSSFLSLFIFYVLSYLLSKTTGCFSGQLMTSASDQKLFCEVCSAFGYSFDEFVGEKVVYPSCSSAIFQHASSLLFFANGLSLVLHHVTEDGYPKAAEFHITVLIMFKELVSKIQ